MNSLQNSNHGTGQWPRCNFLLIALALMATLAVGCSKDAKKEYVCEEGYTLAEDNSSCIREADTCDASAPTSIRANCVRANRTCVQGKASATCGACIGGYGDKDGECLPFDSCAELDCGTQSRACIEADTKSAARCGNCEVGFAEQGGRCAPIQCADTDFSIGLTAACSEAHRLCSDIDNGAECSSCWQGYVEDQGSCRKAIDCSLLGCIRAGKECVPNSGNSDARCGECLPGRDATDNCAVIDDSDCGNGSALTEACAAGHRLCVSGVAGASSSCGGCQGGYIENPESGQCDKEVTCDDLNCAASNETCETTPTAKCDACLPNFVRDEQTGLCRAVLTCEQLSCDDALGCAPETELADAYCRPMCADSTLWNGLRCQTCPSCDGKGEDGAWESTTAGGYCICKTKPGYFYSVGGQLGSQPCDEDGDGWLRESARNAMASTDPHIRANARCEVKTIDRVELINEAAQSWVVPLEQPVSLFESDRTDSDLLWTQYASSRNLPTYGVGVVAHDINRMTKICHTVDGDYNDNGVADITEHSGLEPAPSLLEEHRVFNRFSYFMELHWGRYEAAEAGRDYGRYVVREKSRRADGSEFAQFRIPSMYNADDGSHWRGCRVARDSAWEGSPTTGLDFAEFDANSVFSGMNHHSQFKCVRVNNDSQTRVDGELATEDLVTNYRPNHCSAATGSLLPGTGGPSIGCNAVEQTAIKDGDVLWAAALYTDHRRMGTPNEVTYKWNKGTATYTRGCVNDCVDEIANCPGVQEFDGAIACIYDAEDFGRFQDCDAQEICDGDDNDFDDRIDEGNPGGGASCLSGLLGRCERGHLLCEAGEIICDPDWDPTTEACNNLDDDCDGEYDENVGAGPDPKSCIVKDFQNKDRLGICALGELLCDDGSYSKCYPTEWDDGTHWEEPVAEPLTEVGCNGIDDDCDGKVDECPLTANVPGENCPRYDLLFGSSCDLGWNLYAQDADGDGYPAKNLGGGTVQTCACTGPSGYIPSGEAKSDQDCCDTCDDGNSLNNASSIRPGQLSYSSGETCCESYLGGGKHDFNCNNTQDRRYNTYSSGSCGGWTWNGSCGTIRAGWVDDDVACGVSGTYQTGLCSWHHVIFGYGYCEPISYTLTQECR